MYLFEWMEALRMSFFYELNELIHSALFKMFTKVIKDPSIVHMRYYELLDQNYHPHSFIMLIVGLDKIISLMSNN
jgi:hypothetical protein